MRGHAQNLGNYKIHSNYLKLVCSTKLNEQTSVATIANLCPDFFSPEKIAGQMNVVPMLSTFNGTHQQGERNVSYIFFCLILWMFRVSTRKEYVRKYTAERR